MTPEAVVRTFAQIAASHKTAVITDVVEHTSLFAAQRFSAQRLVKPSGIGVPISSAPMPGPFGAYTTRVLSAAQLHKSEQLLRIGWVWFAGTTKNGATSTRYCFPAISAPVAKAGIVAQAAALAIGPFTDWDYASLVRVGDTESTNLIEDPEVRAQIVNSAEFGGGALVDNHDSITGEYTEVDPRLLPRLTRLNAWYRSVAGAVGIRIAEERLMHEVSPYDRRHKPGVAVIVGYGLYLDRPVTAGTRQDSLLETAAVPGLETTALGHIYGSKQASDSPNSNPVEPDPMPLRAVSARQKSIAAEVIKHPVAVLSGAPGTGKSHLLTVIALEAVARGESVLVAASSPYAVDVLVEHFSEAPGPTPVAFGGSAHGQRLATELSELASRHRRDGLRTSDVESHHELTLAVHRSLEAEIKARRLNRNPRAWLDLAEQLERAGDLFELDSLVADMRRWGVAGWWSRRRNGDTVSRRLGRQDCDPDTMTDGIQRLKLGAAARRLLTEGGLDLTATLDEIVRVEVRAAEQRGDQIVAGWLDGLDGAHRRTLGVLANALSLSRSARRAAFARISPDLLTEAAPLWVGSVQDIDDVLPVVPGMFDLLILDEASQIDQLNSVSALVRAKRVVVCGDPHQLGHVSFTSDEVIADAASARGVDPDLINPRRLSMFDVAATSASLHVLDEHFRSAPHLIEFSARRIYAGGLHLATRRPANEAADHINVQLLKGRRNKAKVNEIEVDACLAAGRRYMTQGWRSIGFLSPFRAQADALEQALLDAYRLEEIEHYGIRVGTVHSFQGDERDVIIASWAIGHDDGESPWRFVNQRDLFNVMVTRARQQMEVVTSVAAPPGLAGEYLRWAEPLTNLTTDEEPDDAWIKEVASTVRVNGLAVRTGYKVGRHTIDVVIGDGDDAVAVDCAPHQDGPAAHLDRALMLRRAGWRTADAFPSRWQDKPERLGVELRGRFGDPRQGA